MSDEPRPMSQEEIDALFNNLGGSPPNDTPADPPTAEELESSAAAEAAADPQDAQAVPDQAQASSAQSDEQTDQDAGVEEETADEGASVDAPAEATAMDDAGEPDGLSPEESGEDALSGAISPADSALTQSDIDALLSGLGDDGPEDGLGTESLPGEGPATATLTPEKLAEVMARQEDAGEESGAGTGIISQDDVDALLAQMGEEVEDSSEPAPDATVAEDLGAAMQQHESDIDALLQEAGDSQATAVDAVMPSSVLDSGPAMQGMSGSLPGAVMSPEELRGGRYLLIAAVGLLAMCTVTLFLVVSSINRLTEELYAGRTAQEEPADDFEQALEVASSYLNDPDPDQVRRGVLYVEKMQSTRQYEDRYEEVTLLLGRHYRGKGAHEQAWRQYRDIADRAQALLSQPAFYLEYADSLMHSTKLTAAERVIYELIANADYYRAATLPDGTRRSADELAVNEEVLRQAYVLLGQLYHKQLDDRIAVTDEEVRP